MTTEQREQLREVLIDYIQLLTTERSLYNIVDYDQRLAQVRTILREVV